MGSCGPPMWETPQDSRGQGLRTTRFRGTGRDCDLPGPPSGPHRIQSGVGEDQVQTDRDRTQFRPGSTRSGMRVGEETSYTDPGPVSVR